MKTKSIDTNIRPYRTLKDELESLMDQFSSVSEKFDTEESTTTALRLSVRITAVLEQLITNYRVSR